MKILFLDAEFVDNQEVIELSIWNHEGMEVYHNFFRPAEIRKWPLSQAIHNISPEDVKDCRSFASCRPEIQSIFDQAEYVVGFATGGDVAHLVKSGIKGFERKQIIDIKHLFWLYVGIGKEIDFYGIPGLSKVAEMLGVEFGEKGAHSASEDTLVTLKCFNALAAMIPGTPYSEPSEETFRKTIECFKKDFAVAKEEYERRKAHGWIHVFKGEDGIYKIIFKKKAPEQSETLVAGIEVGDLSKAESDVLSRYQRRMIQGHRTLFKLTKSDLKSLMAYTNEFGNEEEHNLNKKLLQLRKMMGK
ncbi:MAG: hypothetical protein K2N05_03325 [Muribaculaceae bacterium]|nr:hypothetical protein [Muribaculaceae bacterium]